MSSQEPEGQKCITTATTHRPEGPVQDLKEYRQKTQDLREQKIPLRHVNRKPDQAIVLLQEVMREVQVAVEVPAEAVAVVQAAAVQDLRGPEEANSITPGHNPRGK